MRRIRLLRNVHLGVKTLWLHKLRSLLTMLGVVFGVASVIAMLAVGEGASQQAMERIRSLGSQNILIRSAKPAEEEEGRGSNNRLSIYGLKYEDPVRIEETFAGVERLVPAKIRRETARVDSRQMELRVVGTTPGWFELVQRDVVAGRVLESRDLESNTTAMVLSESAARRLLARNHTVGQSVRIGGHYFEVVGIVKSASTTGEVQAPDQPNDAYIPLSTMRHRFGDIEVQLSSGSRQMEQVELSQLIVQVATLDHVVPVSEAIEAMLDRFHPKGDWTMQVPLTLLRQARATKRTFNIVLGSIAGISLLVGGIGIMNIMLASVTERTREIGIRRAIGAKRGQIVGQFLIETVVLASAGGVLGIAIGLVLPWAITHFAGMPTAVTALSLVLAVGVSLGVGLVFGIYPAYRAAALDPITALRHE